MLYIIIILCKSIAMNVQVKVRFNIEFVSTVQSQVGKMQHGPFGRIWLSSWFAQINWPPCSPFLPAQVQWLGFIVLKNIYNPDFLQIFKVLSQMQGIFNYSSIISTLFSYKTNYYLDSNICWHVSHSWVIGYYFMLDICKPN